MTKRKLTQGLAAKLKPIAKTLADKMNVTKYPDAVYWLDPDCDVIQHLIHLRTSSKMTSCGCNGVVGEWAIDDSLDSFTNVVEVEMDDCYLTVRAAIDAIELRRLQYEKVRYIDSYSPHSGRKSKRTKLLADYPQFVNDYLTDNLLVADTVALSPTEVKVSLIKTALDDGGWETIFARILAIKFPTLTADDQEEDE